MRREQVVVRQCIYSGILELMLLPGDIGMKLFELFFRKGKLGLGIFLYVFF